MVNKVVRKRPVIHKVGSYEKKNGTRVSRHLRGSGVKTSRPSKTVGTLQSSTHWAVDIKKMRKDVYDWFGDRVKIRTLRKADTSPEGGKEYDHLSRADVVVTQRHGWSNFVQDVISQEFSKMGYDLEFVGGRDWVPSYRYGTVGYFYKIRKAPT